MSWRCRAVSLLMYIVSRTELASSYKYAKSRNMPTLCTAFCLCEGIKSEGLMCEPIPSVRVCVPIGRLCT